ncbi:MAG: Crp/Fnr family transcriptional regulator [Thermoanaerobaculia bacterium]|nr:Crp/Fnr family transcriptional regulator [Thermoanaerobaculia bacterium]
MPDLAQIETVVFLQSVDLFSFCKAEEVLRIASIAHEKRFAEGERIFKEGDEADMLYSVVQGAVKLEGSNGESWVAGPLATFGYREILSGRLRTETATATAETLVLAIEAEDFFDLLSHNIEIVKALFRQLLRDAH